MDVDGVTFRFRRTDTDEGVRVTYHVRGVPEAGPATQHLAKLVEGTATADQRSAFTEAWHGRVRAVLADDGLFTVEEVLRDR